MSLSILRLATIEEQREKAYQAVLADTKMEEHADDARARGGHPDLLRLGREDIERIPGELKAANVKGFVVLLLETDPDLVARVRAIQDNPVDLAAGPQDIARAEQVLEGCRERLDELTRALAGRFAPQHQLPEATPTKQLPPA